MNDQTLLTILAASVGIWILILVGQFIFGWFFLYRLRFQRDLPCEVAREVLPADIAGILESVGQSLLPLGFRYDKTFRNARILQIQNAPHGWYNTYFHPETSTLAYVSTHDQPEPGRPATLIFTSYYPDKTLITDNRFTHNRLPMPADQLVEDACANSLKAHWDYHQARIRTEIQAPVTDTAEMDRHEEQLMASLFDYWQSNGVMRQQADHWRMTPSAITRQLRKITAGAKRMARLPPMTETTSPEILLAAELHAWQTSDALTQENTASRLSKVLWFAGSALLGLLAFSLLIDWTFAFIIMGVLLVHEFGHAIAMRLLGYTHQSVLVLPFLGAVAIGRKDDATPWQKLIVLLAGPLPGLLLSVACIYLAEFTPEYRSFLYTTGTIAFFINLLNLLPFTPLDGGQITDTLLFARHPRLRFTFNAVSVLALIALGMVLKAPVLTGAAIVLAMGLPANYRRSRLLARIPQGAQEDPVGAIFSALSATASETQAAGKTYRLMPFTLRLRTVRTLLPSLKGRAPTRAECIGGLSVYLVTILLPLALLWHTGMPRSFFHQLTSFDAQAQRNNTSPDWEKKLAQAHTPEERWKILYEAGQWFEEDYESTQAQSYYRRALEEALQLPAGDQNALHLIDTRLALARNASFDDMPEAFQVLLPSLRALPPADKGRLAEALETLTNATPNDPTNSHRAWLEEAITIREALNDKMNDYPLIADRLKLARMVDTEGETTYAEKLLRKNLATLREDSANTSAEYQAWILEQMTWFYLAHDAPDEAELLLNTARQQNRNDTFLIQGALAWVHLAQGRDDLAYTEITEAFRKTAPEQNHQRWQRLTLIIDGVVTARGSPEHERPWQEAAAAFAENRENQSAMRSLKYLIQDEAKSDRWERMRGEERLAAIARIPSMAALEDERRTGQCSPRTPSSSKPEDSQ